VCGQLRALATLLPGKEPTIPIGQEAGWTQSLSRSGGEEKNSLPYPYRDTNAGRLTAPSLVTILTELSRFPKVI